MFLPVFILKFPCSLSTPDLPHLMSMAPLPTNEDYNNLSQELINDVINKFETLKINSKTEVYQYLLRMRSAESKVVLLNQIKASQLILIFVCDRYEKIKNIYNPFLESRMFNQPTYLNLVRIMINECSDLDEIIKSDGMNLAMNIQATMNKRIAKKYQTYEKNFKIQFVESWSYDEKISAGNDQNCSNESLEGVYENVITKIFNMLKAIVLLGKEYSKLVESKNFVIFDSSDEESDSTVDPHRLLQSVNPHQPNNRQGTSKKLLL